MTNQDENEYFIGPIKVADDGRIGSIGNNLILFNSTGQVHRGDEKPVAKFWDGKTFGSAIRLPEGRSENAFDLIGNILVTNPEHYDNNRDEDLRAWVLEKEKFVEIPHQGNFPTIQNSIYSYSRTSFVRSAECPLRGEYLEASLVRVWNGEMMGPEIPLVLERGTREVEDIRVGNSFVAYCITKKDKQDLVARAISGSVLGEEQTLAEGIDSINLDLGNNFLGAYRTYRNSKGDRDSGELTAWVLKDGIFTPKQHLANYLSWAGGGFVAGGNMIAYSTCYSDQENPIYAFILK